MKRAAWIAAVAWLLAPAPAAAYHPPASFDKTANEGGGNGVYFTGSPLQKGYDCSICHVEPDETIAIGITSDPAELTAGAYTPGTLYTIDVELLGEHRGFGSVANENTFLAELVTDEGVALRGFTQVDLDRFILLDSERVIATRASSRTQWQFKWRAPEAAGAGPITLYVGMLDGDGAGDAERGRTDPFGDDTATLALRLCEGGGECEAPPERPAERSPAYGGCAVGGGAAGAAWLVALALLVAAGRRRGALLLAVAVAANGCFDPIPPAECRDRVCATVDAAAAPDDDAGPVCAENWTCTPWEAPLGSDEATRTCTDTNAAGTADCKPAEGPVTLPGLDMEFYKCRVHPIVQRGCAMMSCHGTLEERTFRTYARGRLRNDEIVDRTGTCIPMTGQVNLDEAGSGTVMCEGWLPHTELEWKKNFDSARSFMLGVDNPDQSDLLREPVVGGKPHIEIKLFRETDPDYQTIRQWLGGATLDGVCDTGVN